MPAEPAISFSEQAARTLLASPRAVREKLLREIERLRTVWNLPATATMRDVAGRELAITHVRPWAITWWLHPVDWEIRILRIEAIRP
jgi:hypothetical protein